VIKRLLPLLFAICCAAVFGQTDSGTIRIFVVDASSAPIGDAAIKLSNIATGVVTSRISASDGYASFTPITRGNYVIDVAKAGFQQTHVTDLSLDVDENKLVRVNLQVASVSSTVDVSDSANIIQSEQGSLGQVIQGSVAVELPLAARRYTQLALLVPGATDSTLDNSTTRGVGWFVVNGNYQTQNNFILEGVDNNQGTNNAQSLSAQVVSPSPDAIAEFKVQTNSYSAEFGRSAGAVVNVVLKSGTNALHGSAWYYNRNAILAATPWASNLIGAAKPDLQWNQFGGTIGGPIIKNKLFYFGDYEGFKESYSTPFVETVPTAAEHNGVFYRNLTYPGTKTPIPGNQIPTSMYDPLGVKLLALYPAANLPGTIAGTGQNINNYGVQPPGTENDHKGDAKADYYVTGKDILSLRFSFLRQSIYNNAIFPGIADGVGNQGSQFNMNQSYGGAWTRTFSPNIVNAFRFGYTSTNASFAQNSQNGEGAAAFGFQGIPAAVILAGNGGLPLINPSNYNNLGTRGFRPQYQKPTLYQVLDSVSIVRGQHNMKTGFETRQKSNVNLNSNRTVPEYDFNGNFTGEALADMLTGQVYQFVANTQEVENILQKAYAAYFQDDWKILPNLTLNLGLRWEYETPYYGAAPNENINFNFQTGQLFHGNGPTDYLVNPDHLDFGPRIGAAWQIMPNKLVLRAGYGLFYSGEDMSGSDIDLAANPPNVTPVTLTQAANGPPVLILSQPVPANILSSSTSLLSVTAREQNYHAARIHQFNVALQYQLPKQSTFEVAYVGNRGYNELAEYSGNQVAYGLDGSVPANRPYPMWNTVQVGATTARSWYNSLQLKFEKRLTEGWYTLASYTFASAIDQAGAWGAGSSPQFRNNFAAENGPQSQTPRHNFTLSDVYELPVGRGRRFGSNWNRVVDGFLGGWQVSNIMTIRTGLPLNVTLAATGINPATNQQYKFLNMNGGSLRPDLVGNPNTGISPEVNRNNFLSSTAFVVQPLNTPGDASRNVALGPGLFNMDLSLVKRFAVNERSAIDIRADAFNSFNTVNFGNPGTSFGSSTFGVISTAGNPRIMQLAVRYRF
jgi:Carboxypeptidase regulatory-like domain